MPLMLLLARTRCEMPLALLSSVYQRRAQTGPVRFLDRRSAITPARSNAIPAPSHRYGLNTSNDPPAPTSDRLPGPRADSLKYTPSTVPTASRSRLTKATSRNTTAIPQSPDPNLRMSRPSCSQPALPSRGANRRQVPRRPSITRRMRRYRPFSRLGCHVRVPPLLAPRQKGVKITLHEAANELMSLLGSQVLLQIRSVDARRTLFELLDRVDHVWQDSDSLYVVFHDAESSAIIRKAGFVSAQWEVAWSPSDAGSRLLCVRTDRTELGFLPTSVTGG